MKNIRIFLCLILLISICNCAVTEPKSDDYKDSIITNIEITHAQNLSVESLKDLLSNESFSEREKDFFRYYMWVYLDDPKIREYIEHENSSPKNENIYRKLLVLSMLNFKDSLARKKILEEVNTLDPNNIYVLMENYFLETDFAKKIGYLTAAIERYPNNDLVLSYKVLENRLGGDSSEHLNTLNALRKRNNNYYTSFIIGNEYVYLNKVDSAITYYNRSLKFKRTIGAHLQLADLYSRFKNEGVANAHIQSALELDSLDDEALTMKAWHYFDRHDTSNARKTFDLLLKHKPFLQNYQEKLLFYLCNATTDVARTFYFKNVKDSLWDGEKAGYFLVFETLKKKNQDILHQQIDSIKTLHGLAPIEYCNGIVSRIIEARR